MKILIKYSGISVILGGIFLILTNSVFTPLINFDVPFIETATTSIYLFRMCFAAITALFLLFGTIGIHLYQEKTSSSFGSVAFLFAFLGCTFLLSNEWSQIFVIPELAKNSPDALLILDSSNSFSLYDIGAIISITSFSIGWLLFAISMILNKVFSRLGPILIIAGFFITPLSSSFLTHTVASIIGNTVLGIAFCLLGREVVLNRVSSETP